MANLCYTIYVQKRFLASGFLYHAKTQQILLHQPSASNSSPRWSMFYGMSQNGEDAQAAFTRIMYEFINVRLLASHIYPVYDYFFQELHKIHYVFYAEVQKMPTFPIASDAILSWFTFKQTTKLPFGEQTKHDIIISERVINAQARDKLMQHTISIPSVYPGVPLSFP